MKQGEQPTETLPASVAEAFARDPEDAQAADEPVADIAAAMADGEAIKAEIIEVEAIGRVLVITAEPKSTEATELPENDVPTKKPAGKGRGKKGSASMEGAGK